MNAINLRIEYLKNPLGIDITKPRFFWNCEGGIKQSAYQIYAVDDENGIVWDSGKVESDAMTHILYGGKPLKSRERVIWKVRLWDESNREGAWSEKAFFEIGLLKKEDWKAMWITGDYRPKKKERYPVDCFRKNIKLSDKSHIKKARIYAAACGIYEIRINGEKAGDFCLAPGYTDYNKRIQYQTIDVTELVKKSGEQTELTAELASGWYRGSIGAHGLRCEYGKETKLLVQMEITYEDGHVRTIISDDTWQWSNDGTIRYADNKDGEYVDANKAASYKGKAKITSHPVTPSASNNVALTEHEIFEAKFQKSPSGHLIADFGQNLAGYLSMEFTAKKGQIMRLLFGELLDKTGELMQSNIQCISRKKITPLQEVLYVCKEGKNTYHTRFAIFGFQYVEMEIKDWQIDERDYFGGYLKEAEAVYGIKQNVKTPSDFKMQAIAVYSDFEETGFFESSNPLLNQFVHAAKWSTKGNSADIPTDCPTRERHGWTGDAQIFFKSASYLFDYTAFSRKYLRDVYDWQKENGKLPQIAPYGGVDLYMQTMNGSVGWADAGVLIPYFFYQMNGDDRILTEYYDRMKKYAGFMMSRCGKWGGPYAKPTGVTGPYKKYLVNCGQSYDEWAEPQDVKKFHWTDFAAPHPEVSTAYTAHIMHLMVEIARITGHNEDVTQYKQYEKGCTMAYRELIKQKGFGLDTDRQARLVRPLAFHLLDEKGTEYAKKRLQKAIKNYGFRLGTGFLSTPLILNVLSEYDLDTAYKLLENEEIPGWLSMPKAGATTIWESWEGASAVGEVASLNHYSKGALCEWLFSGMCGIQVDGQNHFTIHPLAGGNFTYAKAEYRSVYGKVASSWRKENGKIIYEIEIPANTTAHVVIGQTVEEEIGAGVKKYEIAE